MIWNWYNESRLFKAIVGGVGVLTIAAQLLRLFFAGEPAADMSLTGILVTHRGEHRCQRLPDGSEACLNTNSEIHYTFNRSTRNIELVSGEASFVVRNDRRPFDVVSRSVLIHDLSTSFDVYQKRHSTQVTVLQGRVKVIAPMNDETRGKFDLAEAESELIAGFHSEYSGMKFGMFFVGEYMGVILISAMLALLYFGGWLGPVLPGPVWFGIKTMFFICVFVLLRGALPRPRFDQLMSWGWKVMLPLALVNLLVTGAFVLAGG